MAYTYASRRRPGRMPKAPARKMGTWKMAYADFLTALMAFFLVMWLVQGVPASDRAELAEYFGGPAHTAATGTAQDTYKTDIDMLAESLAALPAFAHEQASLAIVKEVDAIRLEIMDSAGTPLFDTATGDLNGEGARLTRLAAAAIAPLPHAITIEGHTDAFPTQAALSNWDLSSQRAHTARAVLTTEGVDTARIRAITGRADTKPLNAGQPHLSANRRISIILHIVE